MQGVYKITNLITQENYVGVSIHIEQRWKEHQSGKGNKRLFEDFKKFGVENFSFEVLEECLDEKEMYLKEPLYIKKYNAFLNGYNETPGGEQGNFKAIEKTKKKIYCYDLNGNFITEYDSLSDAERATGIANGNISRAAKNNGRTKDYQWSYSFLEKMFPYKRKCFTGKQFKGKTIKKVNQYDKDYNFIATYDSISLAGKMTGVHPSSISEVCRGNRKFAGGYIWQFVGEINNG